MFEVETSLNMINYASLTTVVRTFDNRFVISLSKVGNYILSTNKNLLKHKQSLNGYATNIKHNFGVKSPTAKPIKYPKL